MTAVTTMEESLESARVRPYTLTGGRTRASRAYPVEALVHVHGPGIDLRTPEERRIHALCAQSRSVAEVSALMHLPLGVTRILVADLVDRGLLTVHETAGAGSGPDAVLLRRVLAGLRKL